jgi:hypothetical protein
MEFKCLIYIGKETEVQRRGEYHQKPQGSLLCLRIKEYMTLKGVRRQK